MKKLLHAFCLLLGFTLSAQDFKPTFYDLIDKREYQSAERLLSEWEAHAPDDSEIYPARFNLYLNRARTPGLIMDSDINPEGMALLFADSLGNVVGSVSGGTLAWNDSLVNLAFETIDNGIALYPDRLDFHFGKATAAKLTENWDILNRSAKEILNRGMENNSRWLWTDDEPMDSLSSRELMFEGIHEYERILADNTDPHELLDINLNYYPDDHIALTLKGVLDYEAGQIPEAIRLTEKAHNIAPDDMLIVCNLAWLYFESGLNDKALPLYRLVLDNDEADEYWKDLARDMISRITPDPQ